MVTQSCKMIRLRKMATSPRRQTSVLCSDCDDVLYQQNSEQRHHCYCHGREMPAPFMIGNEEPSDGENIATYGQRSDNDAKDQAGLGYETKRW